MADKRIENLARLLVRYSLRLQKKEWVEIVGPANAEELIRACLVEALAVGAYPSLRINLPDVNYLFYKYASSDQLQFISPLDKVVVEKLDAMLFIWGGWNTRELTGIEPQRLALAAAARRPLFEKRLRREAAGKFRWVGTLFPNFSSAQDAEMSRPEYEEFVFGAGMLDRKDPIAEWKKLSRRQAKLVRQLNRFSQIRIQAPDTDITFQVRGRRWVNCDGRINFPDGEVFTSPHEDGTEGYIRYTFPAVYMGKEVENVRLEFSQGKVVKATADKNESLLRAMLATDPGASRVGELAFGTNYSIQRFTKNTLFDEKIGGTVHVALGASLPQTGGKNKSAIHWDMVCDTRQNSCIYGDGQVIARNGKFLLT